MYVSHKHATTFAAQSYEVYYSSMITALTQLQMFDSNSLVQYANKNLTKKRKRKTNLLITTLQVTGNPY